MMSIMQSFLCSKYNASEMVYPSSDKILNDQQLDKQ
jgi:hypothetical protein